MWDVFKYDSRWKFFVAVIIILVIGLVAAIIVSNVTFMFICGGMLMFNLCSMVYTYYTNLYYMQRESGEINADLLVMKLNRARIWYDRFTVYWLLAAFALAYHMRDLF